MKLFIPLAIVAVVVGVFAYTALFKTSSVPEGQQAVEENKQEPAAEQTTPQTSTQRMEGIGTLAALQALGSSLTCDITYTRAEEGVAVTGTYYVDTARVRGDFTTNAPDLGDVPSSMILTDDSMYIWSTIEGETYGIKTIVVASGAEVSARASIRDREPIPHDAEVQYSCAPWAVDASVFEPPSDVLFQDMSALLKAGMQYGTIYEEREF